MNQVTNKLYLFLGLLVVLMGQCPPDCIECDPSGAVCFACDKGLGINVFGQCHPNKIDKCVIYGPTDECFNCEPTFRLHDEKCVKDYSGCILAN